MALSSIDISTEYIGEIVGSSTSQFTSESRELREKWRTAIWVLCQDSWCIACIWPGFQCVYALY